MWFKIMSVFIKFNLNILTYFQGLGKINVKSTSFLGIFNAFNNKNSNSKELNTR